MTTSRAGLRWAILGHTLALALIGLGLGAACFAVPRFLAAVLSYPAVLGLMLWPVKLSMVAALGWLLHKWPGAPLRSRWRSLVDAEGRALAQRRGRFEERWGAPFREAKLAVLSLMLVRWVGGSAFFEIIGGPEGWLTFHSERAVRKLTAKAAGTAIEASMGAQSVERQRLTAAILRNEAASARVAWSVPMQCGGWPVLGFATAYVLG